MYISIIKYFLLGWNKANPDKQRKTMISLSKEIGCDVQRLYFKSRSFQKHCNVIFLSSNPKVIQDNFNSYRKLGITDFVLLDKIMRLLGCELTDLIKKV